MADTQYLPYHEPAVSTILVYTSFILLLNVVNKVLDRLLYCGLIGQILVGIAWGVPGANWLSIEAQETIGQLGYLGLILLVYEGGLSTSLASVRQNLWLAIGVAATGILLPIALSFILIPLLNVTPVQAFAAGAAMCSTSLGTTFTVLSTCNLISTRLGTVLTTAAVLDDVVGLIMLQVVSELGASDGDVQVGTILRPVGVSFAVVFVLLGACRYVAKPLARRFLAKLGPLLKRTSHAAFITQSLFLIAIFTGATYAGTSGLFAAYLAGVTMTWWDKSCMPEMVDGSTVRRSSGSEGFESGYAAVTNLLLKPFFFASIGFAIPISQIFQGPVAWRGVIYTILMLLGKLATGLWLVRLSKRTGSHPPTLRQVTEERELASIHRSDQISSQRRSQSRQNSDQEYRQVPLPANIAVRRDPRRLSSTPDQGVSFQTDISPRRSLTEPAARRARDNTFTKPVSLYPSCLLGLAMAARGEIGYLIASVAESSGIYDQGSETPDDASQLFLIIIWAITLCTLIGPVSVGLLVRRVRRLEREKGQEAGRRAALGIWGVGNDRQD